MYWDDYSDYIEPSETDELIEETIGKIRGILRDRVKDELESVKADIKSGATLRAEASAQEAKVERLRQEILNLEEEAELKKKAISQDVLKSLVNKFTDELSIGDEVWELERRYYDVPCKYCDGKGYIRHNGGKFKCTNCGGHGHTSEYRTTPVKKTVTDVRLLLNFKKENRCTVKLAVNDNTLQLDNETKEEPSGWQYERVPYYKSPEHDHIYKSEEEAQADADKENKERGIENA